MAHSLTKPQRQRLLKELQKIEEKKEGDYNKELESLLMKGPIATDEQIKAIEDARNYVNQWKPREF